MEGRDRERKREKISSGKYGPGRRKKKKNARTAAAKRTAVKRRFDDGGEDASDSILPPDCSILQVTMDQPDAISSAERTHTRSGAKRKI